jgi:hypothetical protein
MSDEILNQDEIDDLISRTNTNVDPAVLFRMSSLISPQMVAAVKTMLKRYYFSLTNGSIEEQRFAKANLREAAFKVWLFRNGFADKFEYVNFINNEVKKRGLDWKLAAQTKTWPFTLL